MAENGENAFVVCSGQHYCLLEMLQEKGFITYEDIGAFLKKCAKPRLAFDVRVSLKTGRTMEEESDG
ncbi:hypothetical protein LCGC14_0734160 [marine sediment metagenome]|uniref:Uncharacterized protein n=1 Tax=marine sediment metagenome TaxID=412755 RepID=A0A0F9QCU4_9ZZZZ